MKGKCCLILLALVAGPVAAEEESGAIKIWSGDVELGAVFTSGNTEQESLNLRVDAKRDGENWINSLHANSLTASQDDVDTADKYYLSYQLDRKLSDDASLFGRVAYEDDRFSGFDSQTDATLGYARTLYTSEKVKVTGDLGLGARWAEVQGAETETEFLSRLSGLLSWQLSESAQFTQFLGFEIGDERTITRSESAISANIVGSLAMKFAVNVKNTSDVPVGIEKTDTETTITLVYNF